jgi:hypothetical protein
MNSTSKSKLQNKVGCSLSGSQTGAVATTTSDVNGGFDSIKSAVANNLAEPASSQAGASQDLSSSSDALRHAFLFSSSRSGATVTSDGVRPLATLLHHDHTGSARPRSWEPQHPAVSPHDLQANRESPIFYLHLQDPRQTGSSPLSHLPVQVDLAEGPSHRPPLSIAATPESYLTLPTTSFQRDDAASPSSGTIGMEVQSVRSRGPHAHTSLSTGADLLQTRYSHLSSVPQSLALTPAYTDLGQPLGDLGPAVAAAAHTHGSVDPSVDLDLVEPQLGPSTEPIPSMYWLLFDMDCNSIDRTRDGDVSSLSPPKLSSGNDDADAGMTVLPHAGSATPTPISFIAKWEDMLELERRIRSSSSSHDSDDKSATANLSLQQSKQVLEAEPQTPTPTQDQAVEINRIDRDSRELPHVSLTGTR